MKSGWGQASSCWRLALDQNNHQGEYGECFIRALAAAAGLTVAKPEKDMVGIDLHIMSTTEVRDDYPLMRVQVKSWSAPQGNDDAWRYRGLTEKQFNFLAGTRTVPTFLFLVLVPPDIRNYALVDDQLLRLSHAAYWRSLADEPKIPDASADRKVIVTVPRQNLLTIESLTSLCQGSAGNPVNQETAYARVL